MRIRDLVVPAHASAVVVFIPGVGWDRQSPRSLRLARALQRAGMATLVLDLLTPEEARVDRHTRHLRFDVRLLSGRLEAVVDDLAADDRARRLPLGLLAVGTGAAAALVTAADRRERVGAVVSLGGRPDLAWGRLTEVGAPTLLLVGSEDPCGLRLNRRAIVDLGLDATLHAIPGADASFEQPGAFDRVAEQVSTWFGTHLGAAQPGYAGASALDDDTRSPIR